MERSLRNIIRYSDLVKSIDMNKIHANIDTALSGLITDLNTNDFDSGELKESISVKRLSILKILQDIEHDLNTFKLELKQTVNNLAIPYYEKSKTVYNNTLTMSGEDKRSRLRSKNVTNNDESKQQLYLAIKTHVSNLYAACQLAPGYGDVTLELIAGTPLYIVDDDKIMLEQFREDFFNPVMQRRTNFYTMSDTDTDPLHELPQGQIGCFVIVDYFNFKTTDIIKKYLQSMFKALRPGGVVIFTFNNCDYPKGIDKVDEMYYCYTTGEEMTNVCTEVGFEIIKLVARDYDELDNGISWLEIKKPGTLSTIRAGQGLAEIKDL